jgi:hypothetical protein
MLQIGHLDHLAMTTKTSAKDPPYLQAIGDGRTDEEDRNPSRSQTLKWL